jgi:serine/threonine protein kinase
MSSYEESSTITQKEKEQAITVHDNKTWSTQGQPKLDYEETSKYSIIWANLEDPKSEYEVRKKIGAGSFGVIYDGRRIWDCKPVALKFVSSELEEGLSLHYTRSHVLPIFPNSMKSIGCTGNLQAAVGTPLEHYYNIGN